MRRRLEGSGVKEAELARVLALQAEMLREFAADGVVLLATHAGENPGPGKPPPGLSLTLALANRPASSPSGQAATPGNRAPGADQTEQARPSGAVEFQSESTPFVLEDTELTAFTRERRSEVSVPGIESSLTQFQAQAFVLPKDQAGMAVITVTTFDPGFENEARGNSTQLRQHALLRHDRRRE